MDELLHSSHSFHTRTPLPNSSREFSPVGPGSAGKADFVPGGMSTPSHAAGSQQELLHLIDAIPSVPIRPGTRRKHFSIASSIFEREYKSARCSLPRAFLGRFWSSPSTTYSIDNSNNGGSPPFSLHFGRSNRADTLFVADEDGFVSLIKTSIPKDDTRSSHSYAWLCHRNAIFDVASTASGDQSIRIWDLSASHPALKSTLRGHVSSVKAVKFRPGSQTELVSGAREGNIFLWDTRCHGNGPRFECQPVQRILAAHVKESASSGSSSRRKVEPNHHSVTSVAFLDDTVLASAGANDGTVKLWDLRKTFYNASATGRPRGISSLALNSSKTKLLASSQDHHLYVFDCIRPEQDPVTFSGHVNNSFYVKSSFSPDDRYIVSGSSDYDVYIWDVKHPLLAPLRLKGHVGEVSDVEWCPTDLAKLASSSDDTTVRIWKIGQSRHHCDAENDTESFFGRGGAGTAEAPPSWNMPSSRSEDDTLACLETMIESETSWSATVPGAHRAPRQLHGVTPHHQDSSESPQQVAEATPISRFISPRTRSTSTSPQCSSPPLKQTTLDDLWQLRGSSFHRPVARSGRVECSPCPDGVASDGSPCAGNIVDCGISAFGPAKANERRNAAGGGKSRGSEDRTGVGDEVEQMTESNIRKRARNMLDC